jgi:hypothetical protein
MILVDVTPPGIFPIRQYLFFIDLCPGQLWNHKPMLLPPFHLDAVRVFSTVPIAGFFFAGYRWLAGEFFPRFFCIAPVCYRV